MSRSERKWKVRFGPTVCSWNETERKVWEKCIYLTEYCNSIFSLVPWLLTFDRSTWKKKDVVGVLMKLLDLFVAARPLVFDWLIDWFRFLLRRPERTTDVEHSADGAGARGADGQRRLAGAADAPAQKILRRRRRLPSLRSVDFVPFQQRLVASTISRVRWINEDRNVDGNGSSQAVPWPFWEV